jgi:hypothetical protein
LLEHEARLQKLSVYVNPMSADFDDIGWRVSETYFCLILSRPIVDSLKGGTLNDHTKSTA